MKTKSKYSYLFLILVSFFIAKRVSSQEWPPSRITPNALMDTVYDIFGNKTLLKNILFSYSSQSGSSLKAAVTTSSSCGYFNVYYASGCGMENSSNSQHINRRNVICQLLSDISAFIPMPVGSTGKVNLLIDASTTASSIGAAGVASGYYAHPSAPLSSKPGIADNEIWKTIHNGVDSYTGTSPSVNLSTNGFYHGFIAFDFTNVTWNEQLTSAASGGQMDLYTVGLHEITHALGFASLISSTGISKYGSLNNYYSRYDLYLRNKNNLPLLTSTVSCNPIYGQGFNTSVSVSELAPSPATCTNDVIFAGSVNQKCYTPSSYSNGSSLSHFADECHTPTAYGVGAYYVMAWTTPYGVTKRFLKQEERMALCDLGYKTNTTYGTAANLTYTTYTGACNGIQVAGICDGVTSGIYTFTTTGNTITIPLSTVVSNDYAAALPITATCIENVYASGSVSVTGGNIVFTATPGFSGPVLLKYVPKDANNVYGNITYIFGFVYPAGCTPVDPCDMVQNGGFENVSGINSCGNLNSGVDENCWYVFKETPDIFTRGCSSPGGFDLGTNTFSTVPAWNSYNGTPNDKILGLYEGFVAGGNYNEAVQNFLSASLTSGSIYTLKFWYYNYSGVFTYPGYGNFNTNPNSSPCIVTFASSSNINVPSAFPGTMNVVLSNTLSSQTNVWKKATVTFTYTGPSGHNVLSMGLDYDANVTASITPTGSLQTTYYILFDDISLLPVGFTPTLTIPTAICEGEKISDLSLFAQPAGGYFTGTGVSYSGGVYSFNNPATTTLTPGTYTVSYTYTTTNGCSYTESSNIQVLPSPYACACFNCNAIGASGTMTISPAINNRYCINNNITINGAVTFSNVEVKLATGIAITVANNSTLTIDHSHLFSNTELWAGITVQNGGRLNVVNNSLIEDASVAVNINNHTATGQILTVDNSIFNRNGTDIFIQNYSQNITPVPFTITNSAFTCRSIFDCKNFLGWPSTATLKAATNPTTTPLQSPYINSVTYPVANIKSASGGKSVYGVRLVNVGTSTVTTTSGTYNEMVIGTASGSNTSNVFDTHTWFVYSNNSNVTIHNSIFQNGVDLSPGVYAKGIWGISGYPRNNRLQVSSSGVYANKFYDITRSVFEQGYHELIFSNCEVYSTKTYTAGVNNIYGVSASSNHYSSITLNNNKIYNIDNALVFNATTGSYSVGTVSGTGQYLGSINANNNIIRSHLAGYTPTTQYGYKAIMFSTISGASAYIPNNQVVNTNNNVINDYENGIFCSNWPRHRVVSESNSVIMRNSASNVQYGIEHDNNNDGSTLAASAGSHGILSNNVTANTISSNPSNYAIRSSQNIASAVRCNTVSNTYNGIAYSGTAIQGSYFFYNDFTGNNKYGFVLENGGIIGQQGAIDLGPTDNRWLGTSWASPNFKTATLGTSSAVNSRVYIRLSPDFNPSGSAYTDLNQFTDDYYYTGTSGTLRQGNFASYPGCNFSRSPGGNGLDNTFASKVAPNPNTLTLMEEIAVAQPGNNTKQAQALRVAKNQVLKQLNENNDLITNSTILNDFYNSNMNNEVQNLNSIETQLFTSNYNSSTSTLSGITPQTPEGAKYKLYLNLLAKYQAQPLNNADEQQLLALANGCPSLDGTFVHNARTLYNVAFDKNINFKDNCISSKNAMRFEGANDDANESSILSETYMLYPNPTTTDEVMILTKNAGDISLDVEVNSSNGLSMLKQNVTLQNSRAKLNLKAANGVYIVIITNSHTKERVIKKLIIQK